MFNEDDHPRGQPDNKGQFIKKEEGTAKSGYDSRDDLGTIKNAAKNKTSTKHIVKVNLDADIQKQLNAAETPKERQKIAFQYIMDNLRGKYTAPDGRIVAIERVGADKMTYRDNKDKLRACPALADMIKAGEYDHSALGEEKPNKKFDEFAYYKVRVQIGDEIFNGLLNVGIREDGSSTLYDLRPFHKEE